MNSGLFMLLLFSHSPSNTEGIIAKVRNPILELHIQGNASYLVVNQVVKSNNTSDERRKIDNQHHIICFHCT